MQNDGAIKRTKSSRMCVCVAVNRMNVRGMASIPQQLCDGGMAPVTTGYSITPRAGYLILSVFSTRSPRIVPPNRSRGSKDQTRLLSVATQSSPVSRWPLPEYELYPLASIARRLPPRVEFLKKKAFPEIRRGFIVSPDNVCLLCPYQSNDTRRF